MSANAFALKPDMLLGVTCGGVQSDGGDFHHSWNDWYERGRIPREGDPALAANHWERWREDVMLMRRLGIQTCRLTVDWARIEPMEGRFDDEAIRRVKEELMLMLAMGIRPLLTLHQCTDPMWFERAGGWENDENVSRWLVYVEHLVRAVGHLAAEYVTFSRANTYAVKGWFFGVWPPGKKSASACSAVMSNLASAHIRTYRLIHEVRKGMGFSDSSVGFANEYRVFSPKARLNPAHRIAAGQADRLYQGLMTEAMLTGEFRAPLRSPGRDRKGLYADFHAVDYDTRSTVTRLADGVREGCAKSDAGTEIYPAGLIVCCRKLLELEKLPLYVVNGVCDLGDSFRSRFLCEHIRTLCESGLPVKRYYYRSFLDGFEWLGGEWARSGLVQVDFETMERSVKPSGEFYGKLIRSGGVSEALYAEYAAQQRYHV